MQIGGLKMKLTLEEKVIILNKTVADIEKRNPNSNKYFLEGFRFGVTMAIKIFLEHELD
jgi:hypothetical protein